MSARPAALALALAACSIPPRDPLPEPPSIERFDAAAVIVRAPARDTTVSWRVRGAERVELRGLLEGPLPVAAIGERAVEVADRVALELVAEGPGGTSQATLELVRDLADRVELRAFEVSPPSVRVGDAVDVSWDAPGALAVSLRVVGGAPLVADGPRQGATRFTPPRGVTDLEVRADGPGGPLRAVRRVEAREDPPAIQSFSVRPAVGEEGQPIAATWELVGPTRTCTVSYDDGASTVAQTRRGSVGVALWALPAGRYRFALACEGPGGEARAEQRVAVVPATVPVAWIAQVVPERVGAGGSVDVVFGAVGTAQVVVRTAASSETVEVARGHHLLQAGPETFAVTIEPADRPGRAATATVTVDPALPVFVRAAASGRGLDVELTWSIAGASRLEVRGHDGGELYFETPDASGDVSLAVHDAEVYLRLVAEGPAGATSRVVRILGR